MKASCGMLAAALLSSSVQAGVISKLQVHIPKNFSRPDGYEHQAAHFGNPLYGGSIQQNVYYTENSFCDSNDIDVHSGYPERERDYSGQMLPWPSPFLLLIDRGGCTFVTKVRNAQRAGAAGVIVADTTCQCSASNCQPASSCESRPPILADDGSGADISIPSFLMAKQDVDPIKRLMKERNQMVRMEMSWQLPNQDGPVEYELWTTPTDAVSMPLQRHFKPVAQALGHNARFRPRMKVMDGVRAGCQRPLGKADSLCSNLCTNNGRYCAYDPDGDVNIGRSGADVVTESLRRICIWRIYGQDDGIGTEWWDYIAEFEDRCDKDDYFSNQECWKDAMAHAKVDATLVDNCMISSGGLEGDRVNSLLEVEVADRDAVGAVVLPALYINSVPVRGAVTIPNAFSAICASFPEETIPDICTKCLHCQDTVGCVTHKGKCPDDPDYNEDRVSTHTFALSLLCVVGLLGGAGVLYYKKTREDMREQVRGILTEYMPLEDQEGGTSLHFSSSPQDRSSLFASSILAGSVS